MKVLVLGSDPNALVCGLQLKRSGHEVEILEGSCFGGLSSLLPSSPLAPEAAALLGLGATLEIVGRVAVSSQQKTVSLKLREISGEVSERDQNRWSDFVKVMNNGSEVWRALFVGAAQGQDVASRWREFGRRQAMEVLRLPCQSLSELLDDWFESDLLKAALAACALRGARQGPFAPGSAFLLLQRWARGEVFGRSRLAEGELRAAVEREGILIHAKQAESFVVSRGTVQSLRCSEGQEMTADLFISSEDPVQTLKHRVGVSKVDPDHVATSQHWDNRSTTVVAKLAPSDKWGGAMVNFCDSLEQLERAYDPTKYGEYSQQPFAELDSKSGFLYLQHLAGAEAAERVETFCTERDLGAVEKLLTPGDIEQEFGASGGHLFGGEKTLWQSYALRESLRNPLSNLYLCGAGTGPGDHSGVSGLMCAEMVVDLALR